MSRYTEAVFDHPVHGQRVYFCDTIGLSSDAVVYRARQLLRDDPRNEGLDEREFTFEGFRYPQGPTDVVAAPAPPALEVIQGGKQEAPALRVIDGGKKKAPVAW